MDIRRVVPNLKASAPLERSRQFYEGVIGLELAMDLGWIISFRSRSNPTAQLAVLLNDATAPVHPDVSVEVEDVDAVYRKAEGAGAEIIHPLTDESWGVRRFFVRDPNGAVINVLSHRANTCHAASSRPSSESSSPRSASPSSGLATLMDRRIWR